MLWGPVDPSWKSTGALSFWLERELEKDQYCCFTTYIFCFGFFIFKNFSLQPCLFSSGSGVWVTLLTAAALNPHRWGCSRCRREKLEQLLLPGFFFFPSFFLNFFFSCLFTLNRSCNSQLKEACQGKAKTNGVHCFDLLFSLEKGHGPILPDLFFFYMVLPL